MPGLTSDRDTVNALRSDHKVIGWGWSAGIRADNAQGKKTVSGATGTRKYLNSRRLHANAALGVALFAMDWNRTQPHMDFIKPHVVGFFDCDWARVLVLSVEKGLDVPERRFIDETIA